MRGLDVRIFPDPAALGEGCARDLAELAASAAGERGAFHVALSGGSTPRHLYLALRTLELPWAYVHVYFSDERTVAPDSAESNYRLAHDELLGHVSIPETNVHRLRGELDPHEAARSYAELLPDRLDLVLLGMGDDGHTASLFPDTRGLEAGGRVVANEVPQLGTWRLSFTFDEINAARERWLLVTGEGKAPILRAIRHAPQGYPVERVADPRWYLDKPAARGLQDE